MKSHGNHWKQSYDSTVHPGDKFGSLSRSYHYQERFSLIKAVKRFLHGLQQNWIAIRYHVFFRQVQFIRFQQKTWVRLSVLLCVFLYVFGKDGASISLRGLFQPATADAEHFGLTNLFSGKEESGYFRSARANQLEDIKVQAYIRRFNRVARLEAQRFGIPASIQMAQAISESWAGEHPATLDFNNHFGRPFAERPYASAWENWRAHSIWITRKYPEMLRNGKDYKRWARALQQSGYSNEKRYGKILVGIIEKYHLYTLDE